MRTYLPKAFDDENFAFFGTDAQRHAGAGAAVEAGGRFHHRHARRRRQQALRRANISRRRPRRPPTSWSTTSSRRWAGASTSSSWMAPETKAKAHAKLAAFTPQDRLSRSQWRDYQRLRRSAATICSAMRCAPTNGRHDWNIGKLGEPICRWEWGHDPDDDQRLRQFEHGRDRLPGRDPSAALLRSQRRRRRSITAASARSSATK